MSIIGAASSLADPALDLAAPARASMAATIRDEGERLDRYIQNLLDMTRLGHGALVPKRVPADLREIAGSARHRLRGALRDHRVEVAVPDDLPQVLVDPLLIEQVVMNLLDNAAKYAPEGSRIDVTARVDGARAELSVGDDGPGIPADARGRVFDMFYRVAEGDGQRAGTGLGLAIARGIVEAHGGTIAAHPARADGRGTRITLTPAAGHARMTPPARILIIDDEAPIRRFLRVALEAQGHHVTEAATGRDGIEACALTTPRR